VPKGEVVIDPEPGTDTVEEGEMDHPSHRDKKGDQQAKEDGEASNSKRPSMSESTRATTFLMRRRSSGTGSPKPIRSNTPDMRQHLKHLGPSNAANRPKSTRINTVKIKPGVETIPEATTAAGSHATKAASGTSPAAQGGLGEGLVAPNFQASDGVQAVHQGYGTMSRRNTAPDDQDVWKRPQDSQVDGGAAEVNTQVPRKDEQDPENPDDSPESPRARLDKIIIDNRPSSRRSEGSHSTISSLPDEPRGGTRRKKTTARSGSITEQTIDVNGVKKMVLDISSSSDGSDEALLEGREGQRDGQENGEERNGSAGGDGEGTGGSGGKKKRKKRAGKKRRGGEESRPLLGDR